MDTQQGTPAWFNARKGKLTASRFGAAAGICPYTSRAKALRMDLEVEKWTGNVEACVWGTTNEKNAVKDYMIRTGNVVTHKGFLTHPNYPWLGGSPDGLVGEEGIIEVKCPFAKKVPHIKIPPVYYCQINGLLEIMNRQWCDYISWTPSEMKVYRVYRDPDLFNYLLDRYCTYYAFMRRGCHACPRVTAAEKKEVLARIEQSDQATNYTFWRCTEPDFLNGKWDGPPEDPFLESSDDDSSKREREDGPSEVRKLPKPDGEVSPSV